MNSPGVKRLIYLAPVLLNSPAQRPHHFAYWARQRLGCEMVWVQPYPVRLPRPGDLRRWLPSARAARAELAPAWHNAPWLQVLAAPGLPVEPLPGGAAVIAWQQRALRARLHALLREPGTWLVIGRPSGLALELCTATRGERVLYDVMDDMAEFSHGLSQRWMRQAHALLGQQAQTVWGSSRRIVETLASRQGAAPVLVRNGTVTWKESAPTPDMPGIGQASHADAPLVMGYVGTIARWFDWPLLLALARALPELRFELVGPMEGAVPRGLPSHVRLHGPVPHEQVFPLMRRWHAGLIPFRHDALTASVDPVKYYEYRACGLPVLATLFGEMPEHARQDDGVWPLETLVAAELPERLHRWHRSLAERHAVGLPLAPPFLRQATWAARFDAGARACGWL